MPIIPQTLNISNLRTKSAKSTNLHTIRKLSEYSLKNIVKVLFTLAAFEILLSEGRSVLSPAQKGTGTERFKKTMFDQFAVKSKPIVLLYFLDDIFPGKKIWKIRFLRLHPVGFCCILYFHLEHSFAD